MEKVKLNSKIKSAGNLAKEAFITLGKLQKGEKKLVKTGNEFIDSHLGGILPSDTIIFSGGSGSGKTKLLFDTFDQILSKDVNPLAENYVTLEYSLEMQFLNRILRDSNKLLKKSKTSIIAEEFTEEEKVVIESYYKALQDDRRFICEESVTTSEFLDITRDFCTLNKDKDAIIVGVDHVLLVQPSRPNEDALEVLTNNINLLRQEFKNVYFILLTQLNRKYLETVKDKDNNMIPTTAMIYGSSHFEFLASWIVTILDPFKMGVDEFLKVNADRYDWLSEYMTPEDKKGKVSFDTLGNQFIFVLKTRESDTPYKNLFIKPMDINSDQLERLKMQREDRKVSENTVPTLTPPPTFDLTSQTPPLTEYSSPSDAFGDDEDIPF